MDLAMLFSWLVLPFVSSLLRLLVCSSDSRSVIASMLRPVACSGTMSEAYVFVPWILGLNFFMSFGAVLGSLMLTALADLMAGASSFSSYSV